MTPHKNVPGTFLCFIMRDICCRWARARDCSGTPTGFALANPRTWSGKPGFFARLRAKKCAQILVLEIRALILILFYEIISREICLGYTGRGWGFGPG
jgi:hypothetical protein